MTSFDFITSKDFRESLEADYNEMRSCVEAQAWKSVQVLAGSIVEALLIDYLSSTKNPDRKNNKDPLKLDLAEAIAICREEKVLSERAADLCSVVKSYRNLIHPGRMLRLNEQAPNIGSATVAQALIDMITDDLVKTLRASVGLTSEQILSKIERDANSLTILRHLLAEVLEPQKERLLLELIPSAHQKACDAAAAVPFGEEEFTDLANRFESAYRIILDTVSTDTRKRVASEFVRVLKEEDGGRVLEYGNAFFRPTDLVYLSSPNIAMVREHIIGNAPTYHNRATANRIKGLAPHLDESQIAKWLDPFVRAIVSANINDSIRQAVRTILIDDVAQTATPDTLFPVICNRLQMLSERFLSNSENDKAEVIQEIKTEIEDWRMIQF